MAHLKEYKCRGCKEMIYDGNAFCEGCKDKATGIVLGFIEAPTEEVKGDGNMQPIQDWITDAFNDYDKHQKSDPNNIRWKRGRFRASIEKNMPNGIAIGKLSEDYMPKPVEQELIPLDVTDDFVEKLSYCFMSGSSIQNKKNVQQFLSKYGVQEEDEGITLEEAEEQIKQCTGIDKQYVINDCKTATGSRVHKQEEKAECSTVQNIANERLSTPTPQATSVIDIKKHFEANMLDGEDIDDCGGAMLSAKSVLEYLSSLPIHKKRSEGDIKKYVNPSERDSFDAGKVTGIENFLRDNGLLSD